MFITENQNVGDSVLFLLAARTALSNIVAESKNKSKKELISFIRNEASDYEVMHLLLKGTMPEAKYDDVAEMLLFSEFKESMMMNKDFVTEMIGEDIFNNVLNEVDSLYMGTSTAAHILEFESMTDPELAIACMISEQGPAGYSQAAWAAAKKKAAAAKAAGMKGGAGAPSTLARYKGMAAKKYAAGKAALAPKVAAGKAAAMQKYAAAKGAIGSKVAAGKAAAAPKIAAGKAALAKGAAAAKGAATKAGAATAKFAGTKAGMATGGAAAAALAIYAGYKIYKRFFGAAAKACAGQSGAAKTACMNKYKKAAIMKQASAIQSASGTCAKSKDPAKCKAAVASKVTALKAKAAKIAA